MTNNDPRPALTTDSAAAFIIAETHLFAIANRTDFLSTLHAFDDDDASLTDADRIARFADIDIDEFTDNDSLMHFSNPDDIDDIDFDRLRAMLILSYTELHAMITA